MKRIFIVVEGPTEERFVRKVMYDHFILKGIHIEAQQWVTNRKLGTAGGGSNFDLIQNHIQRLFGQHGKNSAVYISTMIDLYAFPKQGNTIYDKEVERLSNGLQKAILLEQKFADRMAQHNFIPYVQVHEFEALLLSDPDAMSNFYTDKAKEIGKLKQDIAGMKPEEINETPEGAPSKRIIKRIPTYKREKTTAGVMAAVKIGLPQLRESCPHFNVWVAKLEGL